MDTSEVNGIKSYPLALAQDMEALLLALSCEKQHFTFKELQDWANEIGTKIYG